MPVNTNPVVNKRWLPFSQGDIFLDATSTNTIPNSILSFLTWTLPTGACQVRMSKMTQDRLKGGCNGNTL